MIEDSGGRRLQEIFSEIDGAIKEAEKYEEAGGVNRGVDSAWLSLCLDDMAMEAEEIATTLALVAAELRTWAPKWSQGSFIARWYETIENCERRLHERRN